MDRILFRAVQRTRLTPLNKYVLAFTHLGDKGIFWIAVGFGMLFTSFARFGLILIVTIYLTYLLEKGIKRVIRRQRPFHCIDAAPLIEHPSGPSFPSGHTMGAYAGAALFTSWFPMFAIPAFTLASVIGYSRIYIGVHYPSDVIAGALLGIGMGHGVLLVLGIIPL